MAENDKVRIRCLTAAKGAVSEGSYGSENYTIGEDGIAEVSPNVARHMLAEQPHMWETVDLEGKLATGQPVPFQPVSKKVIKELQQEGEIPTVEKTDTNLRGGNS